MDAHELLFGALVAGPGLAGAGEMMNCRDLKVC